ncbi:MAG TPA: helix-turn-helix domain-containing protein [bacterium]|nr:helix-turn-helix domain-containing protein [bacterium]HPS29411.1 helix-turn-helix domain-containing protein [bacterium]
MSDLETIVGKFLKLGFNRLEAEVYITLLKESPLTGYRLAQILNKAAANTYKALESLEKRGAVVAEDSSTVKQYTAIPVSDYMNQIESGFRNDRQFLEESLKDIKYSISGDKIYMLQTFDQVLEKCSRMLENAEYSVIVDAFPSMLRKIIPQLEKAAENGVNIIINAYETVNVRNCRVIIKSNAKKVLQLWSGDWMNIAVDGREYLITACEKDGRLQHAIWSNSPYLSFFVFNGFRYEMLFSALSAKIPPERSAEILNSAFEDINIDIADLPGYRTMLDRLGRKN